MSWQEWSMGWEWSMGREWSEMAGVEYGAGVE